MKKCEFEKQSIRLERLGALDAFGHLSMDKRRIIQRYVVGFAVISLLDGKNSQEIFDAMNLLHPQASEATRALKDQ